MVILHLFKHIKHFIAAVDKEAVASVTLDNDRIERVETFKLLGVIFSSDLSWGPHVSYLLGKVSKRYYLIFQLAGFGVAQHDITLIYCAIIRSILEYACAVWHSGLTTTQSNDIERVQKRCLRIIYPDLSQKKLTPTPAFRFRLPWEIPIRILSNATPKAVPTPISFTSQSR